IPRGITDLAVIDVFFRDVEAAGDRVGFADAIDSAALRHGLTWFDDARACGNAVARVDPARHVAARAVGKRQTSRAEKNKARVASKAGVAPQLTHPLCDPRSEAASLAALPFSENLGAGRW